MSTEVVARLLREKPHLSFLSPQSLHLSHSQGSYLLDLSSTSSHCQVSQAMLPVLLGFLGSRKIATYRPDARSGLALDL
jgi:hypothetical protein